MAAGDLVADVFVSAIRSRARFDSSRGSARAWLFGIATNLLHTHLRGRRREREAYARVAVGREPDSHESRVVDWNCCAPTDAPHCDRGSWWASAGRRCSG
ncbi:RNA polymerase sigma factor [Umezawaea sp. NPDC059074]|uniref:RNA polymerase sigma factor n=1 Tax=Umezawaea sp. NPDC059074 TaxID=3346716 RepID=UPI0036BAD197